MIKNATQGVVVYADPWGDVAATQRVQCLWDTYQAKRWLKSIDIIRPLEFYRQAFLQPSTMRKVSTGMWSAAPGCLRKAVVHPLCSLF